MRYSMILTADDGGDVKIVLEKKGGHLKVITIDDVSHLVWAENNGAQAYFDILKRIREIFKHV